MTGAPIPLHTATALPRYARLETLGRWHPGGGAPAVEVVVTFGAATLVLSDGDGTALAHWSLPALVRRPGTVPTYAPDETGDETLAIDDATMVEAIETVRGAVARPAPVAPRVVRGLMIGLAAGAVAVALAAAPARLRERALALLPESRQTAFGAAVLGPLQARFGPACRGEPGATELDALRLRLAGAGAGTGAGTGAGAGAGTGAGAGGLVVVLPDGPPDPVTLPGGIVVLSRAMVADAPEPAVLAGHILAAGDADPMARALDRAGLVALVRLLATGRVPDSVAAAEAAAIAAGRAEPGDAELAARFAQAQVPGAPWADAAEGGAGGAWPELRAVRPDPGARALVLGEDGAWVAMQGVCGP